MQSCARPASLLWIVAKVTVLGATAVAWADPPPPADSLTEFSAGGWGAAASDATASVADDTARVRAGTASLRFETTGGFDTWLWTPVGQDASWDLLGSGSGGIGFWVFAENPNIGFQNNSPWVRLYSDSNSFVEYRATREILNEARGQWLYLRIPLNGNEDWTVATAGNPDLTDVRYIELHADTWDAGFTLWVDGLRLDLPIPPPQGLVAFAGNQQVSLAWQPYTDLFGSFDHYAVYRRTAPFTNVTGMTPIATLGDVNTTTYADTTAQNGVSYHYAATAVLASGVESVEVESVGPRTPRDETDLQIVTLARTPRYPRYDPLYTYYAITEPSGFGPYIFSAATGLGSGQTGATQRWPNLGDTVTYTATVRNRGTNVWSGVLSGAWRVDGALVSQPSQSVTLQPGQTTTFALPQTWDFQSHEIRFTLNVADARPENNTRAIDAKSVAFLSYVDATYYEDFREETPQYPNAFSDDFLDWLNHHMDRFNELFAAADCAKRVHFDVLEILPDDAPDPSVERILFAIFPFRYRAGEGSLRHSGYYHADDDIDYGLLHEMGHQLGLIDLYRLNLAPSQNQVNNTGYSGPACLMNGVSPFLSQHSADAMNHWLDVAHGYYGQYMYVMPQQVRLRVLGFDGQPLPGASVTVYQIAERPGIGQVITNQVKAQGVTDANGEWTLPNVPINPALVPPTYAGDVLHDNPFGYVAVVGTNAVLLLKVEHAGFVDYAWLDITEVNNAYWAGQTDVAVFERRVALGGDIEYYPPAELTELNAASWTSWAQDGQITLSDDAAFRRVGQASLRIDATGGFDNYVRYPGDRLAIWDLSRVATIRVWFYAVNPNGPGFQSGSPWIRLGDRNGFVELHATWDVLNLAIGQWVAFDIPMSGNATWQRTVFGAPDLAAINHVEIHADTWGAGFTLWMDGLRFSPRPCPGDLDYDADVDLADLAALLANFGTVGGATPEQGDINRDGSVTLADLAILLSAFGTQCS